MSDQELADHIESLKDLTLDELIDRAEESFDAAVDRWDSMSPADRRRYIFLALDRLMVYRSRLAFLDLALGDDEMPNLDT